MTPLRIFVTVAVLAFVFSFFGAVLGVRYESRQSSEIVARAVADPALADPNVGEQRAENLYKECETEIARTCAKEKMTVATLSRCLQAHVISYSPGCQAKVRQVNSIVIPCESDIASLCRDVPLGGGRQIRCLIEQKEKLGAECGKIIRSLGTIL